MKAFDVQTIEIHAAAHKSFAYIADPRNLPHWASAFVAVDGNRARMATPQGTVDAELQVAADAKRGTIDWTMIFPDGSAARAFSRVIALGDRTIYSFVLTPPPVPLEELEGALDQQSRTLSEELARLRKILEQ
jgi:hypothetical protein